MHSDPNIERFYKSGAWKKCRESFIKERGGLCEICFSKGLIVPAVHVHHKIPLTPENINEPRITLDHSNLMALCEECHTLQHHYKRWRCNDEGHINII